MASIAMGQQEEFESLTVHWERAVVAALHAMEAAFTGKCFSIFLNGIWFKANNVDIAMS